MLIRGTANSPRAEPFWHVQRPQRDASASPQRSSDRLPLRAGHTATYRTGRGPGAIRRCEMATRTRYAPDKGLTVRMTATMFLLGLVFVLFVVAIIGIGAAYHASSAAIVLFAVVL